MIITAPGFYREVTAEQHFADPCEAPSLNQSLIPALVEKSPLHAAALHPRLNPYGDASQSTRAQYLGEAVHRLALGRGREISPIRYPDYSSSSAREARDLAIANNRIPIIERELVKARDMAALVLQKIEEVLEGAPYETELETIWIEQTRFGPIYCRALLDVYCEEKAMVLDPKALSTPSTADAFGRVAAANGYDLQAVFYKRGVEMVRPALKGKVRFANLPVETFAPHAAQLFEPDDETRQVAERVVAQGMEKFAECLHALTWPSYPKGLQPYTTPPWHKNRIINR